MTGVLKIIFLMLGVGFLCVLVLRADTAQVALLVQRVGLSFLWVLAIHFAAFLLDVVAWQITVPGVPFTLEWLYQLFLIRLAGESFNVVTPTTSMGGEPVKATLLKRCYELPFPDSIASLILSKTLNMLSLVAFFAIGFVLVLITPKLNSDYKVVAGLSLLAFTLGAGLFFFVQRFKVTSRLGKALAHFSFFARIRGTLEHLEAVDARIVRFYKNRSWRFSVGIGLGFASFLLGVVEIYVVLRAMGAPTSIIDAWIIEAAVQLIRSVTFFIPASLGAQDAVFMVVISALTGDASFGLATALARRVREIVWSTWGLCVLYRLKPKPRRRPPAKAKISA